MNATLKIGGMKCGGCVSAVTEALGGVTGVRRVTVSLDAGEAEITADDGVDTADLVAAVREAGYEATPGG